jgi:hypothetical protein
MTHTIVLGGAIAETETGTEAGMTNEEIKAWLHKCAVSCRNYEDHIMAECYEATLAKINADEALIAELVKALEAIQKHGMYAHEIDAALAKAKAVK